MTLRQDLCRHATEQVEAALSRIAELSDPDEALLIATTGGLTGTLLTLFKLLTEHPRYGGFPPPVVLGAAREILREQVDLVIKSLPEILEKSQQRKP
jgi:hypothetical protein